ncbi:TonB-dependent receptor [Pedobacter sp. SL55]|uniref:TonB-dependent receptor n=1 Tax=Pedobacter sp. SL55 TaxID=2995161 RepID=UPI00226F8B44|nr:TonB-dependent receptor [Pedobacter sp. SL55]WAC42372.1 TonB-dependent receptor [Pedobacter sp. SL55]
MKKTFWDDIPNLFSMQSLSLCSMKILIFCCVLFCSNRAFAQQTPLDLNVKDKPLKEVLKLIESKTDYVFFYNDANIDVTQKVNVNVKQKPLTQVLNEVLPNYTYRIDAQAKKIYLLPAKASEKIKVNGMVTEADNQPIIGAGVKIKGTTETTVTDQNGKFSLLAEKGATLLISYVGFVSEEIQAVAGKTLKVVLEESNIVMNEVVVVGYGTVRKRDLTGSISTLKSENFNVGLMTSPTQLMQGRVAGVNITSNGGEPGVGMTVRVRGANSIRSGQDPLYVVDGVPLDITDVQASGGSISGVGASAKKNPLNFLNTDDIESIEVLKDASATAIYGARGSNGVVLVTTKKGKKGDGSVNYSGYTSVSELPKKLDVLTADEFRQYVKANGFTVTDLNNNTDWQELIFRTATTQNHNLSYGGGTENTLYRFSLNMMDQQGIIDKTGMEKYTGRFNVTQNALKNRVKFEANVTWARTNDQRIPIGETGGHEGDVLLSALKLNPTFPVFKPDGSYYQSSGDERNPVAMIKLTDDNNRTDRFLGNLTTTVNIIKNLAYKVNFALDYSSISRKVVQRKDLIYLSNGGTVDVNDISLTSKLMENFLTYETTINQMHRINLLAGHSYQHFKNYNYGLSVNGFKSDEIDYLNNLALGNYTTASVRSGIQVNELQSFFGRVNYSYNGKYLFTGTLRTDGSTKFGENNKYGKFPSASVAWRLSQESFMKKAKFIDELKLRLGWGITGNQEIPNKISQAVLGTGSNNGAVLGGSLGNVTPGITLTRTPNPDLKWESTAQYNLGLDFSLLKNRITGSVDLFEKNTKDVLVQVYAIAPAPTTTVWSNVPNMRIVNRGVELDLSGVLVDKKDLVWNIGANFAKVNNEVKDLPLSRITTGSPSGPGITGYSSQVIMSGQPIGTFWGYKFLGFDASGKSIFELGSDGKPLEQKLGNALPKFTYNFNSSVRYKQWNLGLFFNGVYGNKVYNNLANVMAQKTLLPKGWNAIQSATELAEASNNTLVYSSRFIENGSYFRLSSATLGYTVNTKKIDFIKRLQLYASGNNLFVITKYSGYDPEVNSDHSANSVPSIGIDWTTYPKVRTVTFGLNVEF